MKPLPTLTKPLRSVDIETKEPAQALRERTDSCTVPAAGVVGEAMVALVLASAYREKFGGDHIDDVRAALAAYRSGSDGGAGSGRPGAAGTRRRAGARARGLHGRRQVHARPARRRRSSAWRRSTPTASSSAGSASRSQSFFDREGEAAFRAREEEVVLELLGRRPRRAWWRSAAARCSPSACARRCASHTVVQLEVDPEDAWRRASGRRPPAGARPGPLRAAPPRPRSRSTRRWPTPCCRPAGATRSAPRCRRSMALAEAPAGHAARLGRRRVGRLPGVLRRTG